MKLISFAIYEKARYKGLMMKYIMSFIFCLSLSDVALASKTDTEEEMLSSNKSAINVLMVDDDVISRRPSSSERRIFYKMVCNQLI